MGCQQSTTAGVTTGKDPELGDKIRPIAGKTKSSKNTHKTLTDLKGIGGTERLMSAQLKRMQASNASGQPTISIEADEDISTTMPKLRADGTLMPEEVVRRTSSSLTNSSIPIGNREKTGGKMFQLDFAHTSQRGYYPDDPHKSNQDALGVTLKFAGEDGDALFCVYDGHGIDGHDCAQFAKKKYPQILAKYVRQKRVQRYTAQLKADGKPTKGAWNPTMWPLLSKEDHEQCCVKAFRETNKLMHEDDSVPDGLSGTTAVTVGFHGGRMTVCNVGDCRVVVGHRVDAPKNETSAGGVLVDEEAKEEEKCEIEPEQDITTQVPVSDATSPGKCIAIPLSKDQTPYRKDERDRLRKAGAEIKSIDQMEGRQPMHDDWGDLVLGKEVDIHGDPPRVWIQGENYPGTAFTRSLGDKVAEDIGVSCEPEMITTDLTRNDKYLVIASDGIFEFLTNQEVIDMCEESESPLQACSTLVKAAYDKWLIYERRTDDITVIVCFVQNSYEPEGNEEGTTESLVATANDMYGTKPLRTNALPQGGEASQEQHITGEAQHFKVNVSVNAEKQESSPVGQTIEVIAG